MNENGKWKQELIDTFIKSMILTEDEKRNGLDCLLDEQVGRYYMMSAPSSIYKYYSPAIRNLECVENNVMWYSAASRFNDPFELDIFIDEESLFRSLLKSVPEAKGIRPGSYLWNESRKKIKTSLKGLRNTFEQIKNTTGIACFSEAEDSILMWSHYANNHTGFCVEYDLLRFARQLCFSPIPVVYDSNKACLEEMSFQNAEKLGMSMLINSMSRKAPFWEYEHEWRIIRDSGTCKDRWSEDGSGVLLDSITPLSIRVGCAADAGMVNRLRCYCNTKGIPIYAMEKDARRFVLNKVEL